MDEQNDYIGRFEINKEDLTEEAYNRLTKLITDHYINKNSDDKIEVTDAGFPWTLDFYEDDIIFEEDTDENEQKEVIE